MRTPAQPPACPLRLRLQPAPRQRTAPKSPPPPHAATSGTLGRSAGRGRLPSPSPQGRQGAGLPQRPHNPPPHASPSLRGVRGLVGLSGGSAPRPALMRLQMLLHLKRLFVQLFTNVVASEIIVCAIIYKCVVILAALKGLTPHEVASSTKKRRAERPTTAGK